MSFIPMDIAKKEGGGELTGNALPSQVRAGKTFYNTDPDNMLTGVMGSYIKCKNINTMSDLASTLPYSLYYGSTVVYNNEIHILGGGGGATNHYKWNGSSWSSVSTIPYNFYYGSAVVYNNEIHILGGSGSYTSHYKWNGSTWSSVSTLPYNFRSGSAVVYNNEIHILGGYYSVYKTYHFKWNGSTWTSVSTLPYDFYDGCAVVYNNEIHILGSNSSSYRDFHYSYNGTSWEQKISLPYKFYQGDAVVYNNEIHMLGGYYGDSIQHYKLYSNIYTNVSTIPNNFNEGCAVVYNNELHILGGGSSNNHYKWNGSSWTSVSTLPYNFYRGCAVVYNNEIHIMGGYNNDTNHYKWNGSSWVSVSTLPYNFYNGSAVVYKNEIHLLGAWLSAVMYNHYKWNGSTWTRVSRLPYGLDAGSAVVYNGEIHILGGCNRTTYHYRWDGGSWKYASTLPYEFYYGSAVVYNNEIHILGSGTHGYSCYKWSGSSWIYANTLPYNFYLGSAIVYNNEIHILGSATEIYYKSHYKLNIDNIQFSDLPYNFYDGCAVVYNNEIHLLGGNGNNTTHYKWNGTIWTTVSTLPYTFYLGSVVVYNNEIHILGGSGNQYTKHYKWNGSSWTSASTLPYNFYGGSAVVYNNEIHILGSRSTTITQKYHYKWDGSTWSSVSTLPYNFYYGSAVVYNNEIHILGSYSYYNNHYKWNGSTWTSVSTLPYNFGWSSAVVYNNEIHILGSYLNDNYIKHYKWNGSSWSIANLLPYNFYEGSSVVYNNDIYILGGYSSSNRTSHYKLYNSFNPYIYYIIGDKIIRPNEYYYPPEGEYDGNLIIKANSFADETSGNAESTDILLGKTAYVDGVKITGSYDFNQYLLTNCYNAASAFEISTDSFGKQYTDTKEYYEYVYTTLSLDADGAIITYNNLLYYIYGNTMYRINTKTGEMEELNGPPIYFTKGIAVMVGANLYIYGSYNDEDKAAKADLSKASPTWTSITNTCPNKQDYTCGCNVNGTMYKFGSDGYSYKFTGSAWTAISHSGMNFQYGIAVTQTNGTLKNIAHIFVGYNHYTYNGTTFTLIDSDNPINIDNTSTAAVLYKDLIYFFVFGGVWTFDTINNVWSSLGMTSIYGVSNMSAATCNGYIFIKYSNNLYKWEDYYGDKFTTDSKGDIKVSDGGYIYNKIGINSNYALDTTYLNNEFITIPRGTMWLLVANSYTTSNGAYKGSNCYVIYSSGGSSSTTALAVPKITAFGTNGGGGVKVVAETYLSNNTNIGAISIGPSTTAFTVDWTLTPILTPVDNYCY